MTGMHLSDDELLDLFYCGSGDGTHIDTCDECRARYESLVVRRKQILAIEPQPAPGMLAGQRAVIYARLDRRGARSWISTILACAGATALALGVLLYTPAQEPVMRTTPVSDSELFGDIADIVGTAEPRAVVPIRSLFEEKRK